MHTLEPQPQYLTVVRAEVIEGRTCVMVNCLDHDHFKRLPEVVSYNGHLLGKTGWNSDTQYAHYQSNATILHIERK
jgi:hypothetical protein